MFLISLVVCYVLRIQNRKRNESNNEIIKNFPWIYTQHSGSADDSFVDAKGLTMIRKICFSLVPECAETRLVRKMCFVCSYTGMRNLFFIVFNYFLSHASFLYLKKVLRLFSSFVIEFSRLITLDCILENNVLFRRFIFAT